MGVRLFLVCLLLLSSCATTSPPVEQARRPVSTSSTRLPILFVHGFFGFAELPLIGGFVPGLRDALAAQGQQVFFADLPAFSAPSIRAPVLARRIQEVLDVTGAQKLHIIAHSLGGIDARKAMADFDLDDKVFSLTTLSTPHQGLTFAPGMAMLPDGVYAPVLGPVKGVVDVIRGHSVGPLAPASAMQQVHVDAMAAFNKAHPAPPGVHLFTIAGVSGHPDKHCSGPWGKLPFEDAPVVVLLPNYLVLRGAPTDAVANDGVIPVRAARFGRFLGCIPADHNDEVNWGFDGLSAPHTRQLDMKAFYVELGQRLMRLEDTNDPAVLDVPFHLQPQAL